MDAIGSFWAWWPSIQSRLEESIESGVTAPVVEEVTGRVQAIHPELAWELGRGVELPFAFCLSGEGNASLRRLAERWLERAAAADGRWEFHPARPPHDANMRLEIFGAEVDLGTMEAAFEVDEASEHVDVLLWHAAFPQLDEQQRMSIGFLALDGLLGEDGVERWIGGIDATEVRPDGAQPMASLLAAVEDLAQRATGERFALMQGEDHEGRLVIANLNMALKRIDHLPFDMHVTIVATMRAATDQGMPTPEESRALDVIEDELLSGLGDAAAYHGRITHAGTRSWHFFASEGSGAASAIETWAARHRDLGIEVRWERDEAWEALEIFG